ncbi:MAG: pitrilysin family protein [Nanoarchaeota archaeon]
MGFKFQRKVLDNGMTIIFEKRNLPVVAVAFAVKQGGINETEEEKGISHFIEHLIYKGTPTRNTKKIAEEIEGNGGELNGFTSETLTAYWCKMPSTHLNLALTVLSDIVKNPIFDKNDIEKEREVIFEEIKMHRDTPRTYVFEGIQKNLFEKPFGEPVIGTLSTLKSLDKQKITEKFNQTYQPNKMILGVVGDADFDEIVKFAEKNFGKKQGKITSSKIKTKTGTQIEVRKGIDQANLIFAYHTPLAGDKKSYASQILITLMAGGMSSRLFDEIRVKRNLAYSVKGDSDIHKDYSSSYIYVGTMKKNVEIVKELILEEFEKVAKDLTEKELKRIKEQIIGNYHISMEDSQNQLVNLLIFEINGNAEDYYDFEKNILDVKLKDVKELAKIKDYSFFALVPEN